MGETNWNFTGCTDVIQNYGQWMAASELKRPVSVHDYVTKLRATVRHLQELRQNGVRVYWMTTNSYPLWRGAWYGPGHNPRTERYRSTKDTVCSSLVNAGMLAPMALQSCPVAAL